MHYYAPSPGNLKGLDQIRILHVVLSSHESHKQTEQGLLNKEHIQLGRNRLS